MKKEYFTASLNLDQNSVIDLRDRQGFKIRRGIDQGGVIIEAELKDFLSSFKITNKFFMSRNEIVFDFYEVIKVTDFYNFLRANFEKTPQNIRFKTREGILQDYYQESFYLPDGNILKQSSASGSSWFSFHIISKEQVVFK